jgi:hypothetical protein
VKDEKNCTMRHRGHREGKFLKRGREEKSTFFSSSSSVPHFEFLTNRRGEP